MSDPTTTPREFSVIIADRDEATKQLEALQADAKSPKADVEAAEQNLAELNSELEAAQKAILQAAYDRKKAEYNATVGSAGKRASLRRDMNRLRNAMGLPDEIAGTKSSGPRFDDATLAILAMVEGDED